MSRNTKLNIKMQLPRVLCTHVAYEKMELVLPEGYTPLNEDDYKLYRKHEWTPLIQGGRMRVRIDERTQFFDSKSELIEGDEVPDVVNKDVTCIVEFVSVYNFKGKSGITVRAHQIKIHESECLFDF